MESNDFSKFLRSCFFRCPAEPELDRSSHSATVTPEFAEYSQHRISNVDLVDHSDYLHTSSALEPSDFLTPSSMLYSEAEMDSSIQYSQDVISPLISR